MSSRALVTLPAMVALALAVGSCGRNESVTAPLAFTGPGSRLGAADWDLSGEIDPDPGASVPEGGSKPVAAAPGNAAPVVTITSPRPNPLVPPQVTPSIMIHWESTDADGPGPGVKSYRHRLLHESEPEFLLALLDPDSLRRRDAPRFEGWTEVSGRVESAMFTGLTPGDRYIFMITAFDRRGNYDPIFSFSKNMLLLIVSFAVAGP